MLYLRLLAARCIGRRNDYALQQDNGRYLRVGSAVSLDALARHVAGFETMGAYVVDESGMCHFAVFDADSLDGLVLLLGVQRRLSADGIDSALEGSRRGGHLCVFFASPVAPGLVRRWLLPYCPDGVVFYPKRDWATWEEPGSLMRVPFGVHRLSGRRYPFLVVAGSGAGDRLVPAAQSVTASLEWLATIRRVPVPLLEQKTAGLRDGTRPDTTPYVARGAGGAAASLDSATPVNIHDWCDRQDAVQVIGRYVQLDQRGLGCCPLAGITTTGKTRARRRGFTRRARLVRLAGIATSGGVAAISLISCVSGMASLAARCGGAFSRMSGSDRWFLVLAASQQ